MRFSKIHISGINTELSTVSSSGGGIRHVPVLTPGVGNPCAPHSLNKLYHNVLQLHQVSFMKILCDHYILHTPPPHSNSTHLPFRLFYCIHPDGLNVRERSWFCDVKYENNPVRLPIIHCWYWHILLWPRRVPNLNLQAYKRTKLVVS